MANAPSLSRGQVHRALRSFVVASGLWGAWGQACGLGTAAFTGFALYLGADGAFIALFTSAAYFLALTQLLAPLLSARVRDKKRFVVFGGYVEIAFRGLPLIIPLFVPEQYRLPALVAMVCLSMFSGYAISPFYSTWIANAVPENIRARFASRQTIVSTIVAMIAGFAIGQFLDLFPDGGGFVWVFAAGSLFGFLGYLNLLRAPFPQQTTASDEQSTRLRDLVQPFYDANFRRAALFFGLWTFGIGLAGPLYSVFMLDRLQISYTEVSIFNALFMLTSIAGYRLWAGLIDRFGARPVLQILMTPAAFLPLIWTFNQPGAYHLVPVALVLSGILFSGIGVGINPLLYGLLPQGERRTMYLATWSVTVNLMGALGPLLGGLLVAQLEGLRFSVFGVPMGDLQVIFALSALVRLVPLFLLRTVKDARSATSRSLLSRMLRGNVLSYAYNATIFSLATAEGTRARAAEALGRSGNPLAIEQLVQALADASPRVRRAAARALGESRSESATEPLVRELLDGASDIRSEAAEALGRLGSSTSIDPLVEALRRRRSPGAHQRHPRPSQHPWGRSPRATILALWQRFRPIDIPDAGRRPRRAPRPPHRQARARPSDRLPLPGRALAATQRGLPRPRRWRPVLPLALARGYRPRRRHHPPAAPGNGLLGQGPLHRRRIPHAVKDPVPGGGRRL